MNVKAGREFNRTIGSGKQADGKVDGPGERKAGIAGNRAHERDVFDAALTDPSRDALARGFYAGNREVREQIVDPFLVGHSRKRSYFNVIRAHLIILAFQYH